MAKIKALRSGLVRAAGGAWRLDQGQAYEIADQAADALVAMGAVVRVGGEGDAPADGSEPEAVEPDGPPPRRRRRARKP